MWRLQKKVRVLPKVSTLSRKNLIEPLIATHPQDSDFNDFIKPRRSEIVLYCRSVFLVVVPLVCTSCILFYGAENPPTGKVDLVATAANGTYLINQNGNIIQSDEASSSWWVLFWARQAITFSLAKGAELVVIDFVCLGTRAAVSMLGPVLTLLIVQSRGWPFLLVMWGTFNFALLGGRSRFSDHWLFWQHDIDVFNEVNPR
jgi:hypothetical protein